MNNKTVIELFIRIIWRIITFPFKNIFILRLLLLNHKLIDRIYLSLNFRGLKIEQDNYKKN